MPKELYGDNLMLLGFMREVHALCGKLEDIASASVLESCIDETEGRIWFPYETTCST
jgi:starvation-inducible DNA-binding protein